MGRHIVLKKVVFLTLGIIFFTVCPGVSKEKKDEIPLAARIALVNAQKHFEKNELDKAINVLETFQSKGAGKLKRGKNDTKGYFHYQVHFALGNFFAFSERLSEAAYHYNETVKKNPGFSSGWLNLAKCYYDMKNYSDAADAFTKGYETGEEKPAETLYYAAICYVSADKNQKALDVFNRLLKAHPDKIKLEWKESLVHVYMSLNRPLEALPYIEELAEKTTGKKKMQWQEVLLYQYVTLGMKKKALAFARFLTLQAPLEPKWWKALCNIHLNENRYKPALVALSIYGYLTPMDLKETKLAADLYATLSVPIKAVEFYETALKRKDDLSILKKIARSYQNLYQLETALKWTDKGLIRAPKDQDLLMMKGNLLFELDRFEQAVPVFEKTAGIIKNPGRAWLMLGYAAWQIEDIPKARRAFTMASKYERQKKAAQRALKNLPPKNESKNNMS